MQGMDSQKKCLIHKRKMWKKIYYKFYKHNYQKIKRKLDDDPYHADERHDLFKKIRDIISPHFNARIYFMPRPLKRIKPTNNANSE